MGRTRHGRTLEFGIVYDPLPSQLKFHDSPARFKGFSGPIGSGKSQALCHEAIRLAFENLNAILSAAGCSFDDVVDVTVFIVDPESKFETIWKVVAEYWGEAPHPTLTGIGVTWLYGFQFEIKVIAKLPDERAAG